MQTTTYENLSARIKAVFREKPAFKPKESRLTFRVTLCETKLVQFFWQIHTIEYHLIPKNEVAPYVLIWIYVQYIDRRKKNIHRTVFIVWYYLYKKEIYMGMTNIHKIIEKCQKTCNNLMMLLEKGMVLKEKEKGTSLFS